MSNIVCGLIDWLVCLPRLVRSGNVVMRLTDHASFLSEGNLFSLRNASEAMQ